MKKKLITFIILLCVASLRAEDYQYQYFTGEKDKYVPFSDYIPRVRLHYKTVPHYVEDFYELYGMKQYYNENSLRKNIDRLKIALDCKFRHPSEALVQVDTEQEYYKYRNLVFMHLNLLIMRNYLKIAARYDKQRIYFYNAEFADEIRKSLEIAEGLYREARPYWEKARLYAGKASSVKITTRLGFMESERYSIIKNELDYHKIIGTHLDRVSAKKNRLNELLAAGNR
ncbi:MAG TPA: hypothetical protein PK926_17140 [Spirochaetota bacterium]|nr:hypothetical protein [Spirochaetota bacterium]HPI90832.1 hypothetical protein [Spirochaetota bacterium]HPR47627.1 hypothetical protein [Spirochaetota bacterium]